MEQRIVNQVTRVVCGNDEETGPWDQFLTRCADAHIEQSTAWGRLKQLYGWKPIWVWVDRGGKTLGGAMILTRPIAGIIKVGYVERGPVWDPGEADAMDLAIDALYQTASSLKIDYLVVAPPYCGDITAPKLEAMRFRHKPDFFHPTDVGLATLLIDLRRSEDELLAGMSMTKRQNIRRAIRRGVRVRTGDGVDADTVRELMWAACRRRGISPAPSQLDYFDSMWRFLGPMGSITSSSSDGVKFFLAEIDGQAVSAAVVHVFHEVMQIWRVGWSGTHDECNPNDLLHWEIMKWGKSHGCRTFDFMHIRPDHARALLRGERPRDSYSGVTDFKTSFGGQLRFLPDLYYRSFNPVVQAALNLGGARVMETSIGRDILRIFSKSLHVQSLLGAMSWMLISQ